MQILIVDDDPLSGEMAAAILEDAGHTCERAWPPARGRRTNALERLADPQGALEAVVCATSTNTLPLISGLDLPAARRASRSRELREQGNRIPFVLLTDDDADALGDAAAEAQAVVRKDDALEASLLMNGSFPARRAPTSSASPRVLASPRWPPPRSQTDPPPRRTQVAPRGRRAPQTRVVLDQLPERVAEGHGSSTSPRRPTPAAGARRSRSGPTAS